MLTIDPWKTKDGRQLNFAEVLIRILGTKGAHRVADLLVGVGFVLHEDSGMGSGLNTVRLKRIDLREALPRMGRHGLEQRWLADDAHAPRLGTVEAGVGRVAPLDHAWTATVQRSNSCQGR